jgi:hypothetical protein
VAEEGAGEFSFAAHPFDTLACGLLGLGDRVDAKGGELGSLHVPQSALTGLSFGALGADLEAPLRKECRP